MSQYNSSVCYALCFRCLFCACCCVFIIQYNRLYGPSNSWIFSVGMYLQLGKLLSTELKKKSQGKTKGNILLINGMHWIFLVIVYIYMHYLAHLKLCLKRGKSKTISWGYSEFLCVAFRS